MHRFLLIAAVLLIFTAGALAYDEVDVKNGGALSGTVKVTGTIPADGIVKVTKDSQHCGNTLPREKYVVAADGGVKYAVVLIKEIKSGKPLPKTPIEIDNVKCAFVPHVQAAVKGQQLIIKNTDPMLHNTHLYLNNRTVYNFALPVTGMEVKKPIRKAGLISVECDAHSWMKGYLYITEHPYIAVTDKAGKFKIDNIPPGTYDIVIWHEALGTQEKKVTVEAGKTVDMNIEFKQ